jgi:ribonuclease J
MNCLALEQGGEVLVVDCGVSFDSRGLGVDVVHPDFSALEAHRGRIAGVAITHGHEDHIGALPYFLREFDVPVFGPPYALGLLRERAAEHEVLAHARLIATSPRSPVAIGPFSVEPIRVTHSIADSTALAIETCAGTVVHTGDFKFDSTPPDGEAFDTERLSAIGHDGVELLLSDSTNADAEGASGSEEDVGRALARIVEGAKAAVVVALFASNVHRLQILGKIAVQTHRRLVLLGRGVETHARVARATGYLNWPSDLVWPAERAGELRRDRILAIATGTQGEPESALARLSRGEHPAVALMEGDTVILSSRVIPGREPDVIPIMNDLLRRGVDLKSWYSDRSVHVSGHAHRSEQQRMIDLVRPRAFVPIHGTLHHLVRHAELARESGVAGVHVLENGDVGVLGGDAGTLEKADRVAAGRVHVYAKRALAESVLRERSALAQEGVVVVVVEIAGGQSLEVSVVTRGVIDEALDGETLACARRDVRAAVLGTLADKTADDARIAEAARLAARRSFARSTGGRPLAVIHVQRRP